MPQTSPLVTADYPSAKAQEYQTAELFLTHCGIQRCAPGHSYGPGARAEQFLHFVLNGRGSYRFSGHRYFLEKGDIFWLPANKTVFYEADAKKPWHYAWVAFGGSYAPAYMGYAGFSEEKPVQRSKISANAYLGIIEDILQERDSTVADEFERLSKLYRLLSVLIDAQGYDARSGGASGDYPRETYVEYAQEFIVHHYPCIKIQDVAHYIGINQSYLNSVFKKVLGITPQEYLIQFRLEKAKEFLQTTSMSLKEIAERIGYEDPFTFSKMFKQKCGMSPRAWRAALQASYKGGEA